MFNRYRCFVLLLILQTSYNTVKEGLRYCGTFALWISLAAFFSVLVKPLIFHHLQFLWKWWIAKVFWSFFLLNFKKIIGLLCFMDLRPLLNKQYFIIVCIVNIIQLTTAQLIQAMERRHYHKFKQNPQGKLQTTTTTYVESL